MSAVLLPGFLQPLPKKTGLSGADTLCFLAQGAVRNATGKRGPVKSFSMITFLRASTIAAAVLLFFAFVFSAHATTYYLSPTGLDTNTGLSASTPWLTPKHAVNCGDTILASASTAYSYANFGRGSWGTVTCPSGNNVAWLKCVTFDACKVIVPNGVKAYAIDVSANYWGVQGWEASNLQTDYANSLGCFNAEPYATPLHHVVFANNVAITCPLSAFGGGLFSGSNSAANAVSVDYEVIVGNIAYGGGNNSSCGSNIDIFMPIASDTQPGTHLYIAGNFSFASTNQTGANCWDGNGIILDTLDDANIAGLKPFGQQVVVDNNISVGNGGVGIRLEYNDKLASGVSGAAYTPQIARFNTLWGNSQGTYQSGSQDCGEIQLYNTSNTSVYQNLAVTAAGDCYGASYSPLPPIQAENVDSSDSVTSNWTYSAFGVANQIKTNSRNDNTGAAFSFGTNVTSIDPQLTAPSIPGKPNCSGFSNVPACMATVIANFKPAKSAAQAYGYQVPSLTGAYDPLFPQWLCNVNLPSGLVTMGCARTSNLRGLSVKGTLIK